MLKNVLKGRLVPSLVVAAMLLALVPSQALAQTPAQAIAAQGGPALSGVRVKPVPDLRAAFVKEMADAKARTLTAGDYARIEKERRGWQSQRAPKQGWTKREKVGLIVGGLIILAVTVALLVEGIADDPPFCFEEGAPEFPDCRQ